MKHRAIDFSAPIGQEQRIKELMEIVDELDPETEEAEDIRSELWKLHEEEAAAQAA